MVAVVSVDSRGRIPEIKPYRLSMCQAHTCLRKLYVSGGQTSRHRAYILGVSRKWIGDNPLLGEERAIARVPNNLGRRSWQHGRLRERLLAQGEINARKAGGNRGRTASREGYLGRYTWDRH